MDSTDEKILNLMQGNARITYEELGECLGMSRVAAMKRVKKLEKKGVIRSYNTCIYRDDEVLGFIDIESKIGKIWEIIEYLSGNTKGVRQMFLIGDNRLHMVVVTDSVENLKNMVLMIKETCRKDLEEIRGSVVRGIIKDVYGGVEYGKDPDEGSVSNCQRTNGNP